MAGKKSTVGWRAHEGCLEPEEVDRWVRFIVLFMKWTYDALEKAFWDFLLTEIDRQGVEYYEQMYNEGERRGD